MGDKDLTLWLKLRDEASGALKGLLPSLKQVGLAVGVAAAAGVALSISSFTDFQTSLNNVKAVSQATVTEMALFEQQALDMGASTKFSAQEAADAQAFLAMAGLSVQQSLAALPGTLQLAAAGQMDLAKAADLTTNVMSGYRLAVGDIPRINDLLASTASTANTNVEQLGDAMSYVGPVAAAAGRPIEETAAALGLLASNAFAGERGGTALRGIIATLITPSAALESITGKYALTLHDATGAMLPLDEILGQFNEKGVTSGEIMSIFGKRAGPAMLALLGEGGDALKDYTKDLEAVGDAAKIMAETQQEGIVGVMTNMSSAASTLSIIIGRELEPAFTVFAESATEGMRWLGENIGFVISETKAIATSVAAGFTTVGLAYLAMNARMVATTIATNVAKAAMVAFNLVTRANPIGLLVTAIGAAVAAYVYWSDEINAFLAGAWNKYLAANEYAIELLRPMASLVGIELPASMDEYRIATDVAAEATESLSFAETIAAAESEVLAVAESNVATEARAAAEAVETMAEEVDAFLSTVEGKSAGLDHWGLQLDGIGKSVALIPPPLFDMTGTIEDQSAAVGHWGVDITQFGEQLDVLPLKAQAATEGFLDNITSTFAAAFEGGGGFMGGLQSVMTQGWEGLFLEEGEKSADGFLGTMQEKFTALGGLPLVGPLLAAFGPALIGGISKIWSSFGPSEAELAARKQFAGFHKGAVEALGETQKFADEVQVAINQGWDTTLAETRAGFILFGTDAGLTYDQAFADYERYQQAVGAGNTALMEQIEADYARYREASEEANEAASRAWESASNAAVSAFRASEDAGVSAYDEIFEKAIESGHGQEEAVAQATAAQLAASAEVIAAKREEYAFDAAMNAAMSLGANATAEERKSAARDAATVARESWGAAMDAVADSDQAASDAMNETWDPESGDVVTDTRGAADAIVLKMEQAERDLQIQFEKMSAAAGTEAQSIESSFNSIEIKDQSFTIREHRSFRIAGFRNSARVGLKAGSMAARLARASR